LGDGKDEEAEEVGEADEWEETGRVEEGDSEEEEEEEDEDDGEAGSGMKEGEEQETGKEKEGAEAEERVVVSRGRGGGEGDEDESEEVGDKVGRAEEGEHVLFSLFVIISKYFLSFSKIFFRMSTLILTLDASSSSKE
jgi:hypothetical protein